jgi:hypothetical protein
VIHVIGHGDKQVEEQLATILHLLLHCPAVLERVSRLNDARSFEPLWSVFARDTGLNTLLSKSKFLQLLQTILLGSTIEDYVLQDGTRTCKDYSLVRTVSVTSIFELPAVSSLVILKTRIIVAVIEIL